MAVLLGILVAVTYGVGDFFGGIASKRNPSTIVVAASQGIGLLSLAVVVAIDRGADLVWRDVRFGAIAGSVGMVGVILLYRGLAGGSMSIVAPTTAVGAAIVPFGWGILTGERPGTVALIGVGLALVAVVLVSMPAEADRGEGSDHTRELLLALGAGASFGFVFIMLAQTSEASGMWPVLAARVASVSLVTAGLLATRTKLTVARGTWVSVACAGVLDVTANGLYVLAAREGLLSLVSVLSSLYPAATVVLARVVLSERMSARQLGGIGLALGGVVLIAGG